MKCFSILARAICLLLLLLAGVAGSANEYLYVSEPSRKSTLGDGKMHIFMVGTGNPEFEMENQRKPACLAIIADGEFVLIDAGEGAIQNIGYFGLPYSHISKVFMTHWHSDHFAGLGQVINGSWLHGRTEPVTVYGPFGVVKIVNAINTAYEFDALYRSATLEGRLDPSLTTAIPVEVRSSDDLVPVYSGKSFQVSAFRVDHTPVVPALGYVVQYGAIKIVLSGDTRVAPTLERHAKDADVLVNEALSRPLIQEVIARSQKYGDTYSVNFTKDISKYHSDTIELAKMATRAGVKRLILTHLVPAIPTNEKLRDDFSAGMKEEFKNELLVACDGDEIVIDRSTNSKNPFQYLRHSEMNFPYIPAPHNGK